MQIITDPSNKELKKHGSDSFPFLVSYERLSHYEAGSFLWHWHPEIELTYLTKGEMLYQVNRFTYHLKQGDLLFGNSNVLHAGAMENLMDCEYVSITFDAKLIYGFSKSAICTKYVETLTQDFSLPAIHFDGTAKWHGEVINLFLELLHTAQRKSPFYELDVVILLERLWKCILKNQVSGSVCSAHDKTEYDRIKAMVTFIEQNYERKIALKDIAAHINLCESECCRLFKRYMNLSLFSFLQEYRITRSLEYLLTPDSISSIAEKTGFSDSNYYSKVFTKIKGISPSQYRREARRLP